MSGHALKLENYGLACISIQTKYEKCNMIPTLINFGLQWDYRKG